MPNYITRASMLVFLFLQMSCSVQSQEPQVQLSPPEQQKEQQVQNLDQVRTFSDLSELEDEDSVVMTRIKEIENSTDPKLDMEDRAEKKSGKDKILIVGDSWGSFPCVYNSIGKMIRDVKAKIIEDNRCLRTTKLGVEASAWIGSKQDARVIKFLQNTPKIKYIYLSLGGNDLMGNWEQNFTPDQELELFAKTFSTIHTIMNNYLMIRPDVKIILSGYDFPHFKANHKIGLYKRIFERMGSPSDLRINRALVGFTRYMVPIANQQNIFYVQHLGLAQFYDGISEQNYPARATLSPDMISPWHDPGAIGGDINFASSEASMINWMYVARDAFHLNMRMYRNVMHHTYDNVLSRIIP